MIQQGISGLRHLTEQIQETVSGTSLHEEWGEMLHWYREKAPHLLEPIKEGLGFTNFQEKLGEQAARYLFLKKPEEAISFSPSRLERFSRCPFSHFVSYGLRPEERRIFQIAPREIGDIYHACLMELASALTKEDLDVTHPLSPWMTVTRQQCSQMVRETAERQMMQYREGLFHLGNEERYRSERIYDICDKVCWAVVEQVLSLIHIL